MTSNTSRHDSSPHDNSPHDNSSHDNSVHDSNPRSNSAHGSSSRHSNNRLRSNAPSYDNSQHTRHQAQLVLPVHAPRRSAVDTLSNVLSNNKNRLRRQRYSRGDARLGYHSDESNNTTDGLMRYLSVGRGTTGRRPTLGGGGSRLGALDNSSHGPPHNNGDLSLETPSWGLSFPDSPVFSHVTAMDSSLAMPSSEDSSSARSPHSPPHPHPAAQHSPPHPPHLPASHSDPRPRASRSNTDSAKPMDQGSSNTDSLSTLGYPRLSPPTRGFPSNGGFPRDSPPNRGFLHHSDPAQPLPVVITKIEPMSESESGSGGVGEGGYRRALRGSGHTGMWAAGFTESDSADSGSSASAAGGASSLPQHPRRPPGLVPPNAPQSHVPAAPLPTPAAALELLLLQRGPVAQKAAAELLVNPPGQRPSSQDLVAARPSPRDLAAARHSPHDLAGIAARPSMNDLGRPVPHPDLSASRPIPHPDLVITRPSPHPDLDPEPQVRVIGEVRDLVEVRGAGGAERSTFSSRSSTVGEALLALPVLKTEHSFDQGLENLLAAEGRRLTVLSGAVQADPSPTAGRGSDAGGRRLLGPELAAHSLRRVASEPQRITYGGDDSPTHENVTSTSVASINSVQWAHPRFQYVLNAATSPATKVNEETLTYLNQGQPYEVKLKRLGDAGDLQGKLVRSVMRVIFHERRLQYMEREQIVNWEQARPGDRILDLDIPLSYGVANVKQHRTNAVEFLWDPTKTAGIYVKINCISTEFTAKKHGGEKGVPFRLQVESYLSEAPSAYRLYHCASCQIKVFKPKGADRKHKTDREKLEKRGVSERDVYQPSYECTVLTEIPLDQAQSYLDQVIKSEQEGGSDGPKPRPPVAPSGDGAGRGTGGGSAELSPTATSTPNRPYLVPQRTKSERGSPPLLANMGSLNLGAGARAGQAPSPAPMDVYQNGPNTPVPPSSGMVSGSSLSSPGPGKDVRNFACISDDSNKSGESGEGNSKLPASSERASSTTTPSSSSSSSSGGGGGSGGGSGTSKSKPKRQASSMASVTPSGTGSVKAAAAAVSGASTEQKCVEPLLAETSAQEVTQWLARQRFSQYTKVFQNFAGADLLRLSRDDLIQICGLADGIRLNNALQSKAVRPKLTLYLCQEQTARTTRLSADLSSGNSPTPLPQSGGHTLASRPPGTTPQQQQAQQQGGPNTGPRVGAPAASKSKRQYSMDQDCEQEATHFFKKQRTPNLSLAQKGVYHAVYLEHLTTSDLSEKIAAMFSVPPHQLRHLYVQGPSGIQVLVTDDVVANFCSESRYSVQAFLDEDSPITEYIVHLRSAN